ncbi:HSF-type DNA-binding-domain-containing protein [Suillus cothurnatus]|nr:HSF-type DNA-binding-domain-containing protein [Suillus cothurnatus]
MDYDYSNQQQSPRQWSQPTTSGFSSPASPTPGYYYTPNQQSPSRPTSSSNLTLNLSSLSVTSPVNLGVSPITPVSPPNFSPAHLSPQPPFQFNFESTEDSSLLLDQRRPSTGSRPTSSSELAVEKSVPRKRSLTNTAPPPPTHHTHGHSHSYGGHILPHPIITTTASSPPSISEPSSQGPLTPASSQPSNQIDINATYDDPDGISAYSMADQGDSDDEGAKSSTAGPSLGVIGKPMGTNNFVTKLYQMINDAKSQHFITWTDLGTSFVVSNIGEFSRSILGSHFKHNNFSSFVRQLNMYGFHKINRTPRAQRTSTTSQTWEFSHPKFLRARPDLLDAIKRKALEPDPRERGRVELPGEVARLLNDMRDENKALWREISRLGGRIPPHIANTLSQSSGSSTTGPKLHIGGDDEDDDGSDEGFSFNVMGPGLSMGIGGGGDAWMNWASAEMRRERRKVEKLTGIVRTLCDAIGSGAFLFPHFNSSLTTVTQYRQR